MTSSYNYIYKKYLKCENSTLVRKQNHLERYKRVLYKYQGEIKLWALKFNSRKNLLLVSETQLLGLID